MERLPAEVVLEVLKCLRARDLAFSAQLVCRQWCDLLKPPTGQALWRRAFFVSWPPPLAASAAAAEEAAVAALHDRACVPAPPLPCAPEEPSEPARKPYRKAKRRGQRGTSQTQTQTQTQPEPQPQPEEQKRTKEADWKALCLLRLNTELCDAPKRRLAEVAEIMRAGAQAALRDQEPDDGEERGVTRQPTAVNEEDPMAEEKRRKKKKRAVPKRRGRTAKRKRSDTSEEEHPEVNPRDGMDEDIEAEEDDDTVHIPTPDFPWWEQAAEVQLAVTRAQAIIKSVSSVAYMRRNMRTVLSSMSVRNRRAREVHRLLSALSNQVVYRNVVEDTSCEQYGSTFTCSVWATIFSPATGLPLTMGLSYEREYEENTMGLSWNKAIQPRELALFLRALLVASPQLDIQLQW